SLGERHDAARPRDTDVPRRARVEVLAVVAAAALAGCRTEALPGGPATPDASPTTEPTDGPTAGPTADPTAQPTAEPGAPLPPGGSGGLEVSVGEIGTAPGRD